MRFASSIRSCLRGPELGLGLRHIAHNIVKHTIVIEYRPTIGRRYSLFVHNMGGGLNCASKVFWILSSICNLQFAVVLAVSNIIWVKTSSCCEFILVVMGTMCILYADLTLTQIFSPMGLSALFFLMMYLLSTLTGMICLVRYSKLGLSCPEMLGKANNYNNKFWTKYINQDLITSRQTHLLLDCGLHLGVGLLWINTSGFGTSISCWGGGFIYTIL